MTARNSGPRAPAPKFYSVAEVAEAFAVSTRTVRRWIADSKLLAHRFGAALRIAESDLRAFIRDHRDD
jgi:excisionase family DNA binding protein